MLIKCFIYWFIRKNKKIYKCVKKANPSKRTDVYDWSTDLYIDCEILIIIIHIFWCEELTCVKIKASASLLRDVVYKPKIIITSLHIRCNSIGSFIAVIKSIFYLIISVQLNTLYVMICNRYVCVFVFCCVTFEVTLRVIYIVTSIYHISYLWIIYSNGGVIQNVLGNN